eukprot:CAMPEP_0184695388 /NCGR_PEP_ID=MMETSP0313-20130426/3025_1 /TAXON_ID=2792 /ORGANISM="Porphyridium aerugineum, Strain SAG 1380-2" /LENGTH=891 /DNA_ID=CAMNT_0027153825 /DNA_START=69 /DNA_END=2744 /DNA_ORIENTATION=+
MVLECPVCLEAYSESNIPMISTSCGHSVCSACSNKLAQSHGLCPTCRATISNFVKNFDALNLVMSANKMMEQQQQDMEKWSGDTNAVLILSSEIPRSRLIFTPDVDHEIGKGTFGVVYWGKLDGQEVAIKQVRQVGPEKLLEHAQKQLRRELDRYIRLRNPNIVQFLGTCNDAGAILIITELMRGGSLRACLENHRKNKMCLNAIDILKIARQISLGLLYLHKESFSHGDIKSGNILLTERIPLSGTHTSKAKLTDFGLSADLTQKSTNLLGGTLSYIAPECLEKYFEASSSTSSASAGSANSKEIDQTLADVYSLGVLFWELMETVVPWVGVQNTDLYHKVVLSGMRPGNPHEAVKKIPSMSPDFAFLIDGMWQQQSENRPQVEEVVQCLEEMIIKVSAFNRSTTAPALKETDDGAAEASKQDKSNFAGRAARKPFKLVGSKSEKSAPIPVPAADATPNGSAPSSHRSSTISPSNTSSSNSKPSFHSSTVFSGDIIKMLEQPNMTMEQAEGCIRTIRKCIRKYDALRDDAIKKNNKKAQKLHEDSFHAFMEDVLNQGAADLIFSKILQPFGIQSNVTPDIVCDGMNTLVSLMKGFEATKQSFCTQEHAKGITTIIQNYPLASNVQIAGAGLIRSLARAGPECCKVLCGNNSVELLVCALSNHQADKLLYDVTVSCLNTLVRDDISHAARLGRYQGIPWVVFAQTYVFQSAYECLCAALICKENVVLVDEKAVQLILDGMRDCPSQSLDGLAAICQLASNRDKTQLFVQKGGIPLLLKVLDQQEGSIKVQTYVSECIARICDSYPASRTMFIENDAIARLLRILDANRTSSDLHSMALSALISLSLEPDMYLPRMKKEKGEKSIKLAIKQFKNNAEVQTKGTQLLSSLAAK